MRCSNGHTTPNDARFCPTCGVPLPRGTETSAAAPLEYGWTAAHEPPMQYGWSTAPPPPPPPSHPVVPSAYPPRTVGHPPAPAYRRINGLAVASLVLGIVWFFWVGSLLAVILGLIARHQVVRHNERGMGMAVAGIVLGGCGLLLLVASLAGPGLYAHL